MNKNMCSSYIQSLSGRTPFVLPRAWEVLHIADFKEPHADIDIELLLQRALEKPIDSPPLNKKIAAGSSIAILIEDLTRTSPKKYILENLLEVLVAIGIRKDDISIVVALGTHNPLSHRELEDGFGSEIVARYEFINHDCYAADLVPIGKLTTGTTVKINRRVYDADYRIGIGSIFPHPMNGFGGGGKILFPGVADFDSTIEHHLKYSFRGQSRLGNLVDNAFHQEITRMAQAGRLDFIINSVLDHNDCLFDLVCGDPVQAHKVGTTICRGIISYPFTRQADVTIISAFPYTIGPQIMKPLAPAAMITRPGGCIILCADCTSPLPEQYFEACEKFTTEHQGRLRQAVLSKFENNSLIMEGAPPELNMSMAQLMLALNDYSIILVTTDIPQKQAERLGLTAVTNLQKAITICDEYYSQPTVNVVPSGGVILPVLQAS